MVNIRLILPLSILATRITISIILTVMRITIIHTVRIILHLRTTADISPIIMRHITPMLIMPIILLPQDIILHLIITIIRSPLPQLPRVKALEARVENSDRHHRPLSRKVLRRRHLHHLLHLPQAQNRIQHFPLHPNNHQQLLQQLAEFLPKQPLLQIRPFRKRTPSLHSQAPIPTEAKEKRPRQMQFSAVLKNAQNSPRQVLEPKQQPLLPNRHRRRKRHARSSLRPYSIAGRGKMPSQG
mmetsp:Transcript_3961/g.5742  ORF Transcript_3961/g.5742 Transcript_3961/m.5742 type:complete len:241 (+) Transcript_3961:497-1219(+)